MVYIKLVLTALFWGGTFVAGRVVSQHMSPYEAAFWRFALASLCMVFFTRRLEGAFPKLEWSQVPAVALLGLTGVFSYNILFFLGLKTVIAGRAAVIVALNPIFIALLAALFFGESLTRAKILGVILSVTGAVVVISRGAPLDILSGAVTWGDAAIFGCVASWVAYSLLGKLAMGRLSPPAAVTWSCIFGTVFLCVPAAMHGAFTRIFDYPALSLAAIAYLGFFGTVLGFTWYYQGVKAIGPSRASIFINLVPITAILAGFAFLGEPVHGSLVLGGVTVCLGVYLANRPQKTPGSIPSGPAPKEA